MHERLALKGDSGRGHAVQVDLRASRLKRPGLVGDFRRHEAAAPLGEEAVALDEEVLEGPRLRQSRRTRGLVRRREGGSFRRAQVVDGAAVRDGRHARQAVAEPVKGTPDGDEERTVRVEAEKPDSRDVADADVGPHVQLGNRCEDVPAGSRVRSRGDHEKGDDRDPRVSFRDVWLDAGRQQPPHGVAFDGPMSEQELLPSLREEPPRGRITVSRRCRVSVRDPRPDRGCQVGRT